jgi:fructokinase
MVFFYYLNLQISEDEITFLTGGDDPFDDNVVLKKLFHPNLKLLIVTEGSDGCRYYTKVSGTG